MPKSLKHLIESEEGSVNLSFVQNYFSRSMQALHILCVVQVKQNLIKVQQSRGIKLHLT